MGKLLSISVKRCPHVREHGGTWDMFAEHASLREFGAQILSKFERLVGAYGRLRTACPTFRFAPAVRGGTSHPFRFVRGPARDMGQTYGRNGTVLLVFRGCSTTCIERLVKKTRRAVALTNVVALLTRRYR